MSKDDQNVWMLLERDLASGEERSLATLPDADRALTISADTEGDRWLYMTRRDDAIVNPLVSADGTVDDMRGGTEEQPIYWSFFGDTLIGTSPFCESDCTLIAQTGDAETTFTLPSEGIGITVLAQPMPDSLLVMHDGEDLWLLREGDEPLSVGTYDPVHIFTTLKYLVSPDERYLLTVRPDADDAFLIWNLQTAAPILTLKDNVGGQVYYFERGLLVTTYGSDSGSTLYRYADSAILELPNGEKGSYFEVLPDGSLLYWLGRADESIGERGIYRYDPVDETYTPLIEDVSLLYALPQG
jgi:hypothetical protein